MSTSLERLAVWTWKDCADDRPESWSRAASVMHGAAMVLPSPEYEDAELLRTIAHERAQSGYRRLVMRLEAAK